MKRKGSQKNELDLSKIILKNLEDKIKEKGKKLSGKEIKKIAEDTFSEFSGETKKLLDKQIKKRISKEKAIRKDFESRLYKKWEKAIDLYEILGIISLEIADTQKQRISKEKRVMGFKESAIFRIHARALKIYDEIFCLIRSGHADGANARWRSLYELAVVSLFLSKNNEEVSERYLLYDSVLSLREAKEYKNNYRKLGYPPLGRRVFSDLRKKKRELEERFGTEFVQGGTNYGWVPRKIVKDRTFKGLEKHIKLSRWKPFYRFSSNSIHSNSKCLYSIGLMDKWQKGILLVGPSNYGLADPIQNSVISLLQITSCLPLLDPDIELSIYLKIMDMYSSETINEAIKIQKQIEKEEQKNENGTKTKN